MSRWKVECGFWFIAMQVDEQGREIRGTAERFPTHAEALAFADRQARTVEITVPRVSGHTPIETADGDGHTEPRTECLYCSCGEMLWSWVDPEPFTDSRLAWIAHLELVQVQS